MLLQPVVGHGLEDQADASRLGRARLRWAWFGRRAVRRVAGRAQWRAGRVVEGGRDARAPAAPAGDLALARPSLGRAPPHPEGDCPGPRRLAVRSAGWAGAQ